MNLLALVLPLLAVVLVGVAVWHEIRTDGRRRMPTFELYDTRSPLP